MTSVPANGAQAAQLRREIEQTRLALGDTVAQLAHKADVKAQARERVDQIKAKVIHKREEVAAKTPDSARGGAATVATQARAHPIPLAAVGALIVGFTLGRLIARRG